MTASSVDTETGRLAVLYGSWGLFLVKLGARSKRPIEDGWNDAARERAARVSRLSTPDERRAALADHVEEMARHVETGGNLGLAIPDCVLVVDADTAEAVAFLESLDGFSDAPTQRTRKGRHYVMAAPADSSSWPQRCRVALSEGVEVDLRIAGKGQIAVEPSVHPNGDHYQWIRQLPATRRELPAIPLGIVERIESAITAKSAPAAATARKIGAGSRNDHLTGEAGRLVRAGFRESRLFGALSGLNMETCEPPLPEAEVAGIVASAGSWEGGDAPAQPVFEPLARIESRELAAFPIDALGPVGDFVRALSLATQTPPDLAGVAALGFMAGAVAGKAIVRAGWDEEIALYLAAVAEPGSRKSEVWKHCARPTEEAETELRVSTADDVRTNEAKLALLKKRLGKVETNYANAKDAEGRREAESEAIELRGEIANVLSGVMGAPRLLVADVTPERLAALVAQNGERMILASAEGGQIFDRMFRYSQNGDPNMDLILSGWSGERCSIDRQNAEAIILRRPVLTIVGAIQQHVLESLAKQPAFDGRGLTARFAYSIPKDNRGYRDTRSVVSLDRIAAQRYAQTMGRLLAMEHNRETPIVLAVVGEALEGFNDFREIVEIEQREGGLLEDVRGWASKAPGLALRIAGVLALADTETGARAPITPAIMKRAVDLAYYFLDHSKRALEIMAGDTGDRQLDKLWKWIAKRDTPAADFTRTDAWQGVKGGRFKLADDLDGPLARLVRAGRIARRAAAKEGAGRPATVWAVNPEALR